MKVKVYRGDITDAETEAIVNAANSELWMGSGVAGAIKRLGGQIVEDEAMEQGPIEPGEAVLTTAGNLPHMYVIHAAGMGPDLKTSDDLIFKATLSSLELAEDKGIHSVAFPALGTGVGNMTIEACAKAMRKALEEFAEHAETVQDVHIVILTHRDLEIFKNIMK